MLQVTHLEFLGNTGVRCESLANLVAQRLIAASQTLGLIVGPKSCTDPVFTLGPWASQALTCGNFPFYLWTLGWRGARQHVSPWAWVNDCSNHTETMIMTSIIKYQSWQTSLLYKDIDLEPLATAFQPGLLFALLQETFVIDQTVCMPKSSNNDHVAPIIQWCFDFSLGYLNRHIGYVWPLHLVVGQNVGALPPKAKQSQLLLRCKLNWITRLVFDWICCLLTFPYMNYICVSGVARTYTVHPFDKNKLITSYKSNTLVGQINVSGCDMNRFWRWGKVSVSQQHSWT